MIKKKSESCSICQGYGWYPIGLMSSIGPMDAEEWEYKRLVQCPECGAGGDNKSERYKQLKAQYEKWKTEKRI